jgi:hypothetical protein
MVFLHACDGCEKVILRSRDRIHCTVCSDYDLCVPRTIFCVSKYGHDLDHKYIVYRWGTPVPARSTASLPRLPPPSPRTATTATQTELRAPRPLLTATTSTQTVPHAPQHQPESHAPTPLQGSITGPRAHWDVFFDPSWQPTIIFIELTTAIFERLDPRRTGYLSPSVYSGLLDTIGFPSANNPC